MRDIRADEPDSTRPPTGSGEASEWQAVAEHSIEPVGPCSAACSFFIEDSP
ncbi:hypothetical protein [Halocatena marina]|uniref:Uncharacterized protein n=1 Tax=Halocatena marina TaxID=2934937 RepID=A0ABD5YYH4_9EURY|nr:hypothetical protein [Halocatena marina]